MRQFPKAESSSQRDSPSCGWLTCPAHSQLSCQKQGVREQVLGPEGALGSAPKSNQLPCTPFQVLLLVGEQCVELVPKGKSWQQIFDNTPNSYKMIKGFVSFTLFVPMWHYTYCEYLIWQWSPTPLGFPNGNRALWIISNTILKVKSNIKIFIVFSLK